VGVLDADPVSLYPRAMTTSPSRASRARLGGQVSQGWDAGAIELILFDLDDTLCDYGGARELRLRTAFGTALATISLGDRPPPSLDDLIAASIAIQPHGAEHFPDLLGRYGVSATAAAEAVRWYRTNPFHGLELFPDAVTTLETLRSQAPDRPIGLVTNGPAETQRAKIALLELGSLLDFAVVSGEFGVDKPDPAIFAEALRLGGATAASTLFVGDSPVHDIAGAKAAGMRVIWMNRTGAAWALGDPGPDATVGSLTETVGDDPNNCAWL